MGDIISSIFGGGSSSSGGLSGLLGGLLGGNAANTGATGADGLAVPASDVGGLDFSQMFDPTGSLQAQTDITGNQAGIGPTGAPDIGGTQSSQPAGGPQTGPEGPVTPQAQQPQQTPPPQPPVQTAQQLQQAFSPSGQPVVPGPTGFTQPLDPNQRVAQGFGAAGENPLLQTGQPSPNQQVASRWGDFQQPSGTATQQFPGWMKNTASQLIATGGKTGADTPSDDATSTPASQDATAPAQPSPPTQGADASTQPPTPQQTGAAGQGGGPGAGGIGNILSDIQGIMSGNPQSLMKLVQDVMGMAGGPPMAMGGQQGGGQIATQGPYAGQPVNQIPWAPDYGPSTGRYSAPPGTRPPMPGGQTNAPAGTAGQPRGVQTQRIGPSGQPTTRLPSGTLEAGTRRPLSTAELAAQEPGTGGTREAPSRKADGTMPTGRSAVTPIVTDTLRQAGLPNAAIQGILYNVGRESSFNPSMRHADQPRYGGEPHYAHGLYQEGGGEWNQYSRWLAGRDWRDPKLQTQFLAANLKTNYPQLWTQLRTARSPEEAAAAFATGYLKPARPYLIQRLNDIRRGGVTASATQPAAPPRTVPDLVRRTPPADPWMADAWMQPSQGVPFTQSGDPSTFGGPGYAGMTPSA